MQNDKHGVKTPDFIQIPKPVLQCKELQPSDKFLFGYIYWFTKLKLEVCTASNETLGRMAGITGRSISNSITRLKKSEFIDVVYSGDPRSKKTKRTIECLVEYRKAVSSNNGTRKQGYVSSNNGTGAIKSSTNKEYLNNNKKDFLNKNVEKHVDNQETPSSTRDGPGFLKFKAQRDYMIQKPDMNFDDWFNLNRKTYSPKNQEELTLTGG